MNENDRPSLLAAVPTELPSLLRARRITEEASRVGFDWPETEPVWDKIAEELTELRDAVRLGEGPARVEAELGDLLMAITNLSRFLGVDPERALRHSTNKFIRRFEGMEQALAVTGQRMEELSLDALEELWQAEKAKERLSPGR